MNFHKNKETDSKCPICKTKQATLGETEDPWGEVDILPCVECLLLTKVSDTPMTDSVKVRNARGLWIVNADYMQQVERENTALRAHAERLAEALEEIKNPIGAMIKAAEKQRGKLNGQMANSLSNDAEYLKQIAAKALTLYRAENPKV